MSYNVYKLIYTFSPARDHPALFIETDSDTDGTILHVIGDLQEGMEVQIQGHVNPQDLRGYLGREFLGTMENTRLQEAVQVARATTPPWKQLDHLGRKIRKNRPWYRSEDWYNEVVETLKDWGILIT